MPILRERQDEKRVPRWFVWGLGALMGLAIVTGACGLVLWLLVRARIISVFTLPSGRP